MNELVNINNKNHKIALDSMKKFEKYILEGNIGRACAHLLVSLKLEPNWRNKLVEVFAASLRKWGHILANQNEYEDLIKGYELAMQVYPDNSFVINDFGAFLYRAGDLTRACSYLKKACSMASDNVESERNLQICLGAMVDRWHFRMLNDNHRNEAFREAITKKVKQGFTRVLDIGTGSGLLSLIAAQVCAETAVGGTVFACESSPTMIGIANSVLKKNHTESRIRVYILEGHSTSLTTLNLSERKMSLVVTEILDAGVFGEGVLQTLLHAWKHLLLPPLPQSNNSLCMICTDKKLAPRQRIAPRVNGFVVPFGATVWLAAIDCKYIARKHRSLHARRHTVKTPFIFQATSTEPYDTENLQSMPDDFKLLCEPIKCFFVNFNDPAQLQDFLDGKFDNFVHSLEITTKGNLDAFVVWFDLHVDEDIKITTSPFGENAVTCCWDQAIFPLKRERQVESGCIPKLRVKTKEGSLRVELLDIDNYVANNTNYDEVPVSQDFVRFFNNSDLLDMLSIYSGVVEQCGSILELSPFPFVGLTILIAIKNSRLCYVGRSEADFLAVKKIAECNGISSERINFIEEEAVTLDKLMLSSPYDLIISNLLTDVGELSTSRIDHLSLSKNLLAPDGIILPQYINVWGQLISSEWITRSAEVLEEGIVGKFGIPRYMNEFKVKHQVDINSQALCHTALSEPFMIGIISMLDIASHEKRDFKRSVTVSKSGVASGLLQWFQYEIRLPNCDTLQYSTRSIESHVNQMCVLTEKRNLKEKQLRIYGMLTRAFVCINAETRFTVWFFECGMDPFNAIRVVCIMCLGVSNGNYQYNEIASHRGIP